MNTTTTRQATDIDAQKAQAAKSKRRMVAGLTLTGIAAAAICGAAAFGFSGSTAHATSSHTPAATKTVVPAVPVTPSGHNTPGTVVPAVPVTPAGHHSVKPSNSIKELQRELGQLNYYEGPINGIDGTQTINAIKYLQRDAHLPQTGVMNKATANALTVMLAHGNNVMGGNN
ncbi:peptidoglycan-binding protein [Branchiibius sp. NY16-3462-2]|uniref:peptidoglycan-binding domain-containing protein n=1 Tax=Branchiibius sp. NY16-3462-2 TaxID=1807500 RepID=UPI00079278B7|nr:peptidoglycan-binding domain-containing protein [Branchiibius sp. NY16-3462-2]KYH43428.1 hypothetical protein AZH51_16880 [Branchiibius sp. NY16-3462-2]